MIFGLTPFNENKLKKEVENFLRVRMREIREVLGVKKNRLKCTLFIYNAYIQKIQLKKQT